jgi:hypothetical protein
MATRDRSNTSGNGDHSSGTDESRGGNPEYRDSNSDEKTDADAALKHSIVTIAVSPQHLSDVGEKGDTDTTSKLTINLATMPKHSELDDKQDNDAAPNPIIDRVPMLDVSQEVRKSETSLTGFDASKNAKVCHCARSPSSLLCPGTH